MSLFFINSLKGNILNVEIFVIIEACSLNFLKIQTICNEIKIPVILHSNKQIINENIDLILKEKFISLDEGNQEKNLLQWDEIISDNSSAEKQKYTNYI